MTEACLVDVLVPTYNRPCALAVTLTSLLAQTFPGFKVIVSDQSDGASVYDHAEVRAVLRILNARGREVQALRHLPRLGMAEQRAFLLSRASAPYCLFLDDDVLLESDVVARLYHAITEQACGFVGNALHGLSFIDDVRPHQQQIEFWESAVAPESISPGGPAWARHHLHSAANLYHLQSRLRIPADAPRLYRVAWIGGCVLFDTYKLRDVGGFDFWQDLPGQHCGEDVLAQLRVMARYGGCGMIPSGAYHMELSTTIPSREVDAPQVLPLAPTGAGLSGASAYGACQASSQQR